MIINTPQTRLSLIALFLLFVGFLSAQQNMGVNIYDREATTDGYIFFSPNDYTDSYLIDNCGFLVNVWDRFQEPGLSCHLTPSGLMLRTNKVNQPEFFQASTGGNLELVDWNNNTIWSADFNEREYIQHHDAVLMPNGNIIYLGWERINEEEQIALGRDPNRVSRPNLWGEFVQEVRPIGNSNYEVVWEWRLKDHFIQDFSASAPNYGVIRDDIGKVDINYLGPANFSDDDWWHCNALDYNPELDQILINSRSNGEMWIIDHSTTTAQASGTTGGNSNKGGELLFRWGNPEAYNRGFRSDLRMYGSHGNYWIPEGYPNAGKIMYFNNGDERPEGYYSTVEVVGPVFENGEYQKNSNNRYYPLEPEIIYQASPNPFDFMSRYLSNAKQLSTGNVFINEGGNGRLFEVDSDGNIVWQYLSPVDFSGPNQQGDFISSWSRDIFRAYKYEPDFPGFDGVDLSSGELIEGDSQYNLCKDVSTIDDQKIEGLEMTYDMFSSRLNISNLTNHNLQIQIMDTNGRLVRSEDISQNQSIIDLNYLQAGIYIITLSSSRSESSLAKKIVRI